MPSSGGYIRKDSYRSVFPVSGLPPDSLQLWLPLYDPYADKKYPANPADHIPLFPFPVVLPKTWDAPHTVS